MRTHTVRRLVIGLLAAATLWMGTPALASSPARPGTAPVSTGAVAAASPSPTASLIPAGPPPGERNPVQGVLAVLAIIVAGGAGVFIYRVIRHGL